MSGPVVVSSGWVVGAAGARRLPVPVRLVDVAHAARELGAAVAYVLEVPVDVDAPADWAGWLIVETAGAGREGVPAWRYRVEYNGGGSRSEVSVVVLPWALEAGGAAGPWEGLGPRELLHAFAAFERLTGEPWADGVGRTAERLILSTHPRRKGGTTLDMRPELPEVLRDNGLEVAWHAWSRPAPAGAFVHAFDANAQYLAAWGVAELGHGRPVHRRGAGFDPSLPGVWRVGNVEALPWPDETLPAPWNPSREWFTTPTVARMVEVLEPYGVAPVISEAHVWVKHSRFLRAASERLRDARAAAMTERARARAAVAACVDAGEVDGLVAREVCADVVLEAVKACYAVQTGRFGMGARDTRSGWARPDWANTIRAQARVNLHRKLSRCAVRPFAIAVDGLLFATDEPDARVFAAGNGLTLGTGLGQYKHDGTCTREWFDAATAGLEGRGAVRGLFEAVGAEVAAHG